MMKLIPCTPYNQTIHRQVQIKYQNRQLATLRRKNVTLKVECDQK